jgi:hypothetical protein
MFVMVSLQAQKVKGYEYWIDDNMPEKVYSSITPVSVFHLQTNLPLTGVSFGFHVLNLRFHSSTNLWSSVLQQFFTKITAPNGVDKKIVSYEFWIDDDYASRTIQNITPSSVYHMMDPLNLANVSDGFHVLNLRYKDNDNVWSSVLQQFFTKSPASVGNDKKIVSFEYWVDNDYTSRTIQNVTPSSVYHMMDLINLTSITSGFHILNLRFKDNTDSWSSLLTQFFTKNSVGFIVPNKVVSWRLWYDNDLNTLENYTLTPPVDIYHMMDTIEMPFLTIGNHMINYQFSDLNKSFSTVRTDTFNVSSCLPHGGRVINGVDSICQDQTGVVYSIRNIKNAASYTWSVPAGATILSGNNTSSITVDYPVPLSGNVSVYATNSCGNGETMICPVTVYPPTIAGAVTGGEILFFGMETTLTLEGNVGSVLKWQKRWNGGAWQDIANITNVYSEVPDTTGTWDYRAEVQSGPCSALFSDFTTVTVEPVSRTLNLTIFLEGLFDPSANQMRKAQDENGDKFPGTVADKIQIRLARTTNPYSVYYSVNDVDLNQDGTCSATIPRTGYFYLVVNHRNSIETWSSEPVSLLTDPVSYDFTSAAFQAYGDNLVEISGTWVIYGADVNQDGLVDSSDMLYVETGSDEFATGYLNADVNGDGLVDSSDMLLVEKNSDFFISSAHP